MTDAQQHISCAQPTQQQQRHVSEQINRIAEAAAHWLTCQGNSSCQCNSKQSWWPINQLQ